MASNTSTNSGIIEVSDIKKEFEVGDQVVQVLKGISFTINDGDFVIIFGSSGSGKSTLLHILLGLEPPTSGSITMVGEDIYLNRTEDDRAILRKQLIGMVYQQPHWIKAFNVVENVSFPLLLLGTDTTVAIEKAFEQLKHVNMENWSHYVPTELSSGQQQRVAMARALINNPAIIIADEPTGNLDYQSGQEVMELLYNLHKEQSRTIIMVTHDLEYLRFANMLIRMLDGKVLRIYHDDDKEELLKELHFKRGFTNENTPQTNV